MTASNLGELMSETEEVSYFPVISVIIPIYNVEKYVEKCVLSVLNQTYKNIEVFLIDDGSPDQSGVIADRCAEKDLRVRVVHTQNKGVSAARNLGIDKAKGEWIVFVDGDDYLDPEFISYMYELTTMESSDVVMSRNCFKFPHELQQVSCDNIEVLSPESASVELLFPGRVEIGCWNKMFNRCFLIEHDIKFSTDLYMGEGLHFIVMATQLSRSVVVGKKKLYFYRKDNCTSATSILSASHFVNALVALDVIEKDSVLESSAFRDALRFHRYCNRFMLLRIIILTGSISEKQDIYRAQRSKMRRESISLMRSDFRPLRKLKILLGGISPVLTFKIHSRLK
jgi:glycosyltransferase involved in cell wall biosynthesis